MARCFIMKKVKLDTTALKERIKAAPNRFADLKKRLQEVERQMTPEEFIEGADVCCTSCKQNEKKIADLTNRIERIEKAIGDISYLTEDFCEDVKALTITDWLDHLIFRVFCKKK
jgi:predicted nuclease with TOPRIM domain